MKITAERISKSYGKVKAIDDLSLSLEPGQIVAMLGVNGAGKSTLLKMLAGLIFPDRGEILIDGMKLRRGNLELRKRMIVLPDYPAAFMEMTPIEHAAMLYQLYDGNITGIEERITELFREFNLLACANTPMERLSRGQAYKAALCAAMVLDREFWLFDEPFASGMDPNGIGSFRRHVKAAAARGHTIIYSTQIPEVNENFCDQICIIHRGRIKVLGTIDGIVNEPGKGRMSLYDLFMGIEG